MSRLTRTMHIPSAWNCFTATLYTRGRVLRVLQRVVAVTCCIAWPHAANAQQDAFQQDPVDLYGSRFLAVVIVIGLAVVLYSLFRYRGRDSGPISWGLLLAGSCVFPMILSGFGTILVVERVKTVKLCGSCHLTMKPYVDDMMNPQSNSLAAVHYTNRYIAENQCYECHTSYGMLGTLQAKKQGLIDVYKYYTHTFQLPLQLRHPYPGGDCLKCHAGATKWIAAHEDSHLAIFAGTLTCMQCHAEANPAHNVPGRIQNP
jgi:cytochrome c nitrite reductase small subunit